MSPDRFFSEGDEFIGSTELVVRQPIKRRFAVDGFGVDVLNIQPGVDLEIRAGELGGYRVAMMTNPEFLVTRLGHVHEADLVYRSDGLLLTYESGQFLGIGASELEDAAARALGREELEQFRETRIEGDKLVSSLTNQQRDELATRMGVSVANLLEGRREPIVSFRRTKLGGWNVYVTKRALGEPEGGRMIDVKMGKVSSGEVTVMQGDRRLMYGVREVTLEERAAVGKVIVFYTREEVPIMSPSGIGTITYQKEVAVPDKIDPKKMDKVLKPRGVFWDMARWFPLWIKKPV